jgi:hypothetical protein
MAQAGPWLRERVVLCRYAHIALANLGYDSTVAVADVLMARRLRDQEYVLWIRDPALPDLGTKQDLCGRVSDDVTYVYQSMTWHMYINQ